MNECVILKIAESEKGQIVILEFPFENIPHVEMILQNSKALQWKIIGIGEPIFVDMLNKNIQTHYDSERIWNCLLTPLNHNEALIINEMLSIKHLS